MSEGTGAVVASIAAGVLAIIGTLMGIYVGRRQATDQAQVEHGQWLRGQRLEAYSSLFTAWDTAIDELRDFQNVTFDDATEFFDEHGSPDDGADIVTVTEKATEEAWERLRPYIERAELLGPGPVQIATVGLHEAHEGLRTRLLEQARSTENRWGLWNEELTKVAVARSKFHAEASKVLQTPPAPKGARQR